jgi:hypothetical protein
MPDIDLTRISPVTDAEAARLASPAAFAQLASQITATPLPTATAPVAHQGRQAASWRTSRRPISRRPARGWSRRRGLLTGLSLAALAGAAALVAGLLLPGGNGPNSPAAIQAVSFTKKSGYITVIIRNPYADTSWYNADFARNHLNITLHLIAASPSVVGQFVELSTDTTARSNEIELINKSDCHLEQATCPIGFKIPADFHGVADMTIGRPARPGEQYMTAGSIFDKGEALYGLKDQVLGQPIGQVLALFAKHHIKVDICRDSSTNNDIDPAKIPSTWYVNGALAWAHNEVLIYVGPNPGDRR